MSDHDTPQLVSTRWLAEHLDDAGLAVVDGSWHLPAENRDPYQDYLNGHIPGAVFFDIDAHSDKTSALPHMLPGAQTFAAAMGALGIADTDMIVVYDTKGLFSAARVWWTFKIMGARNVAVLNGGLAKWNAENRPLQHGPVARPPARFAASLDATQVRDAAAMLAIVNGQDPAGAQIIDARAFARFTGEAPEPRPGLRSGHIPGSLNVPLPCLVDDDGTLKSPAELTDIFLKAGADLDRPIVTSCGSGVTAAGLALGLDIIGHKQVSIYDGSWSEWGASADLPIATRAPDKA